MNIIDRALTWAESKEKRLEKVREQTVDKDIEDCTFRPKINYSKCQTTRGKSIPKSTDKFLSRM